MIRWLREMMNPALRCLRLGRHRLGFDDVVSRERLPDEVFVAPDGEKITARVTSIVRIRRRVVCGDCFIEAEPWKDFFPPKGTPQS